MDLHEIHAFTEIRQNTSGNPKIYEDFQKDLLGFNKDIS